MMKTSGEKSKEGGRNINDVLLYELLVRIFMAMNVAELVTVSKVCKRWQKACSDPILWEKVDLTTLCSSPFNIPKILRHDWSHIESITRMSHFLKNTLSLSNGNIRCLVFNFYSFLTDDHLILAAQRTPNLKRLVLPQNGGITESGIDLAMRSWSGLQSITITNIVDHKFIFSAIGKYCKGITELKFTCTFDHNLADALIQHTPNLKFLSVQCSMVNLKALCSVLLKLKKLVTVNACHSPIWGGNSSKEESVRMYHIRDVPKHVPMELAKKVVVCRQNKCVMCKYKRRNGYQIHRFVVFEEFWRIDEIKSLAH